MKTVCDLKVAKGELEHKIALFIQKEVGDFNKEFETTVTGVYIYSTDTMSIDQRFANFHVIDVNVGVEL